MEISVIIPTYNRRDIILASLEAFARQTVPPHLFEIIIVDDGSADGTADAVAACSRRSPMRVVVDRQDNAGPGAARNRAASRARGRLLLIVNDDTIPAPELLAQHLAAHRERPAEEVVVLGRTTFSPDLPPSLFAALHLDSVYATIAGRTEVEWPYFLTCNVSVKASFFMRCGEQFDERFRWHEDRELGERLRRHGMRVIYRPEALGYHHHVLSEQDYLSRAERDGAELVRWYRKSPQLLPELQPFGLSGPPPLRRPLRHRLADIALTDGVYLMVLRLARALASGSPAIAQALYRKLYQRDLRRSVAAELRRVAPGI